MEAAAFPKQAPDGRLFFFYYSGEVDAEPMLVAAPLEDLTQMIPLRPITLKGDLFYSEVLWTSDAGLVVIGIYRGPMHILKTDDSPMITLPISDASNLRWGTA